MMLVIVSHARVRASNDTNPGTGVSPGHFWPRRGPASQRVNQALDASWGATHSRPALPPFGGSNPSSAFKGKSGITHCRRSVTPRLDRTPGVLGHPLLVTLGAQNANRSQHYGTRVSDGSPRRPLGVRVVIEGRRRLIALRSP